MGAKDVCDTLLMDRHNSLFKLASSTIDDAVLTEETTEVLKENFAYISGKIKSMLIEKGIVVSTPIRTPLDRVFNEPYKVRAKGCGKRFKGGKEKDRKSTRLNSSH